MLTSLLDFLSKYDYFQTYMNFVTLYGSTEWKYMIYDMIKSFHFTITLTRSHSKHTQEHYTTS